MGIAVLGNPANTLDYADSVRGVLVSCIPIEAKSVANTQVTLTIPASGVGIFHYITSIRLMRTCTAALAGTAALDVTTTNLPNSMRWVVGNACAVGSTNNDVMQEFSYPIRSSVANTATTIVFPAAGAAVIAGINVTYYNAF